MTTPRLPLPPALSALDSPALFLDVDGTLLDFADRPGDVTVPPDLIENLKALQEATGGALALLSGRPLADLDSLLGDFRSPAAGCHGGQLRGPQGVSVHRVDAESFDRFCAAVAGATSSWEGVELEHKPTSLAVHFRNAPARSEEVRKLLVDLAVDLVGAFEVLPGIFVEEIRPAGVSKGIALTTLMAEEPFAGRVPVVIGDDVTDEDAFVAARAGDGVAVIVGDRASRAATHRLPSPGAVRQWIRQNLRAVA